MARHIHDEMIGGEFKSYSLLSWRSVLSGLVVALFVYVLLFSLGLGLGALGLTGFDPASALSNSVSSSIPSSSYGLIAGVFLMVITAISLIAGSYFASRITRSNAHLIGMSQSMVIAALFFGLMIIQLTSLMGFAGQAAAAIFRGSTSSLYAATQNQATSTFVEDTVGDLLRGLDLKSPPREVAQGVASRLLVGDLDSLRSYVSREANVSEEEVRARIEEAGAQVRSYLSETYETAARALAGAGLALFILLVIGTLGSILGGWLGAHRNVRKPIDYDEIAHVSPSGSVAV